MLGDATYTLLMYKNVLHPLTLRGLAYNLLCVRLPPCGGCNSLCMSKVYKYTNQKVYNTNNSSRRKNSI